MNCTSCGEAINPARLKALPDTKVCVTCSTEEAKGAIDIIYHKTGNTIQIVDKEVADSVNKAARRTGFGSLRAMRGGSGGGTTKVSLGGRVDNLRMPTQEDFERVGREMMGLIDWKDRNGIIKFLDEKMNSRAITGTQYRKLVDILGQFKPIEKVTYSPENSTLDVSDEIEWSFRNWKNSKAYK